MLRSTMIIAAGLAVLAGCDKQPLTPKNCVENECLDLKAFSAGIQQAMEGQAVGYALSVVDNGVLVDQVAWGNSRTAADGQQPMTTHARMNVASVSKTITAITVLRLLSAKQLTPDSFIEPYLPAGWTRGSGVSTVTFRQLLTHTSGFRPTVCSDAFATDYASLQTMVGNGLNGPPNSWQKGYCYVNANYALFRVIIPHLRGYTGAGVSDPDQATADAYLQAVRDEVAAPAGLASPQLQCKPQAGSSTLFYPFPQGSVNGDSFGDQTLGCGSSGLHLSAEDLASILYRLRFTSDLLPASWRNAMYDGELGWQGGGWSHVPVKHGTFHSHGGYLWSPAISGANPTSNCVPGGVREANMAIMDFSVGVQVVLLVNSPVSSQGCIATLQDIVKNAYENAWEAK